MNLSILMYNLQFENTKLRKEAQVTLNDKAENIGSLERKIEELQKVLEQKCV